jgi:hypothetical protein
MQTWQLYLLKRLSYLLLNTIILYFSIPTPHFNPKIGRGGRLNFQMWFFVLYSPDKAPIGWAALAIQRCSVNWWLGTLPPYQVEISPRVYDTRYSGVMGHAIAPNKSQQTPKTLLEGKSLCWNMRVVSGRLDVEPLCAKQGPVRQAWCSNRVDTDVWHCSRSSFVDRYLNEFGDSENFQPPRSREYKDRQSLWYFVAAAWIRRNLILLLL